MGRRSSERGGAAARAGGLVLGRALDPPLEPVLGRELALGRDGAACGLGAACGRDDPAEGRLFEPGAGTARTWGREGAADGLRDSRPLEGEVRGEALGVGARGGWGLAEGPSGLVEGLSVEGLEDGDAGRELAAGGSSGRAGAALGRAEGVRAGSRDGTARVGLGSDCEGSGRCGSAEGGVRTGSRELGRRWSVGRARAESGASCGAVRGLSCG